MLAIEREFSAGDPVLVRTALFGLLHRGQVSAPELHTQPLSLFTSEAGRKKGSIKKSRPQFTGLREAIDAANTVAGRPKQMNERHLGVAECG
ncbi:hypothetical protein [Paraburkholderia hospita]|uniref:hypothetical protein n=1 Tax=Paraburkholderia hospita TaxID=169430 RepID=UPI001F6153D1|nr:hypothetical protein [Paraburkholderia hospita]